MSLQTLFTGWNFTRWLRLILAIAIIFQAIETKEPLLAGLAVLLLYQAIANVGCCGINSCAVQPTKNTKMQEPEFEEIKAN